jgi:hypothetical protein
MDQKYSMHGKHVWEMHKNFSRKKLTERDDNTKMDFKETSFEDVDWINVSRWTASVSKEMDIWAS